MKCYYASIFSCALLFLSNTVFSQHKDAVVFIGDSLEIQKEAYQGLNKKDKEWLKPIVNKEDFYIVSSAGDFTIANTKYKALDPLNDGVTKVLVIGNSFSDDGVESYLYDMARSVGKPLVIGNLFRGGAPLDFHLKNALGNIKIYSYRKTTIDGLKSNTDKTSILEALKDENWDYIVFQQASATSGDWATVEASLPQLFNYVYDNYPVSTVKYLYHQTWAYAQNAVTKNFENYNRDQNLMYEQIVNVSKKVPDLIPVYKVIPTGTAIQNGRTTYIGDNYTREGYHLDLAYGRFTAASTWFETIFGGIKELKYSPNFLSDVDLDIAKESAYLAVQNPFSVSAVTKYSNQKVAYIPFKKIKINFGTDLMIPSWTSLLFEKKGSGRFGVLDENNNPTAVNIVVLQNFDSRNANGLKRISFKSAVPAQVSSSYFNAVINERNQNQPFLGLRNLNTKNKYKITVIATLQEEIAPIQIEVLGAKKQLKSINPSYNRFNELVFEDIKPNDEGNIDIAFKLSQGATEGRAVINGLLIEQIH